MHHMAASCNTHRLRPGSCPPNTHLKKFAFWACSRAFSRSSMPRKTLWRTAGRAPACVQGMRGNRAMAPPQSIALVFRTASTARLSGRCIARQSEGSVPRAIGVVAIQLPAESSSMGRPCVLDGCPLPAAPATTPRPRLLPTRAIFSAHPRPVFTNAHLPAAAQFIDTFRRTLTMKLFDPKQLCISVLIEIPIIATHKEVEK